jgi:hypothetical protein
MRQLILIGLALAAVAMISTSLVVADDHHTNQAQAPSSINHLMM